MAKIFNVVDGDPHNERVKFLPEFTRLNEFAIVRTKTLPETFSRRTKTPAVFNQGSIGSCVGCSGKVVVGDLEAHRTVEISPMWIYKKGKEFDVIPGEAYSGTTIVGACEALKYKGACQEKFWPYSESEDTVPLPGADADAASRTLKEYAKIEPLRFLDIQTLLLEQCLWASFVVYPGFLAVAPDGILLPHQAEDKTLGGHAVALVGWRTIDGVLYWEFQNSWGASFGDKGFFFVSAEYFATVVHGGFYYLAVAQKKADDIRDNGVLKPTPWWKKLLAKIKMWLKRRLS